MTVRQAALGGFLAAALIFGANASPASQADGQASVAGAMAQLGWQTKVVSDGLRYCRNAALDVVFDVAGAVIAEAKQF
jgi:hypothetical protein